MTKHILYFMLFISTHHTEGKSLDILSHSTFNLNRHLTKRNKKLLHVLYRFKTPHYTNIAVLANNKNEKFVVKQDTNNTLIDALKCALRDMVGALFAQSVHVHANDVIFIPKDVSFPGKSITTLPATFHNFVPGVRIEQLPKKSPWHKLDIHLYMKDRVPSSQWGLRRSVIKNMTRHQDLCKIAAIDTFIANSDRSLKNYLYDETTDTFYAIDFECSFRRNLASYCCKTIENLLHSKKNTLTPQEYAGLQIYRDTLNKLVTLYPPETIRAYFTALTQLAGISTNEKQQITMYYQKQYAPAIAANYQSCKQLISLLDRLLALRF